MRKVKLCDKSQLIHFKRTANNNIKTALTHTKAVRKSNNNIRVLGRAVTCKAPPNISNNNEQPIAVVKPKSKSLRYSLSLSLSLNLNVIRSTCSDLSQSTERALMACERKRLTRFVGWWCTDEWRLRKGLLNLSVTLDYFVCFNLNFFAIFVCEGLKWNLKEYFWKK